MQYVNDDMDELFRRAAENYPLDTNSADWSKVAAALQNVGTATMNAEKNSNTNKRLLWLLLLLPLGLICNQLYTPAVETDKTAKIISGNKNPESENRTNNNQVPTANETSQIGDQKTIIGQGQKVNEIAATFIDNKTISAHKSGNTTPEQNTLTAQPGRNNLTRYENQVAGENSDNSSTSSHPNKSIDSPGPDNNFSDQANVSVRKYIYQITRDKADKNVMAINRPLTPVENPNKNRKKPYEKGSKGFYFGLMGGIDFTTVKFQKFEEKGFTHGIVAGYQINNNFSVETGIFKENKYYYSDGKYLNTSRINVRPNSKITEVSGECNMYEVPVNVKYNFSSGKTTWFVSAGSSSYIMKKEDYTYTYYSSSYGPYPVHKQYLNSSKNLFATANISGGYIHNIGNFADLRIEPYFKVPLAGLGIGKLPLLSTGLNIGITKKF